jgi:predicted MFS family arabinose efflux permease
MTIVSTRPPQQRFDLKFFRLLHKWFDSTPHGEFWLLAIATFLFNVGISIFLFLYNLLMLDFGFREDALGVFAGAMALGSLAGTIPCAILARRFGLRNVLALCLLIIAMAFALRACLVWAPAQIACSFCDGFVLCSWVICLSPAVSQVVEEDKRPLAFSILFAIAVASGSLGGLLGGHTPGWCQGMAQHFMGLALPASTAKRITMLAACVITGTAAWPVARLRSNEPAPTVRWLRWPTEPLARFLIANTCWGAALGAFNPFTNVIFSRYLHVPTPQLGNFFSVVQLVQAAAVLTMPVVLRRAGLSRGILFAQLAAAACLAILSRTGGLLQTEVLYCAFMAVQHMTEPALQTLLMGCVEKDRRSEAAAFSFLALSLAQAASAAIAGQVFARFPYARVIACIALCLAGAAIVFRLVCSPAAMSQRTS